MLVHTIGKFFLKLKKIECQDHFITFDTVFSSRQKDIIKNDYCIIWGKMMKEITLSSGKVFVTGKDFVSN